MLELNGLKYSRERFDDYKYRAIAIFKIVLLLLGFFTLVVPIYHFEYEVQPDIVVKVGSRWIHSIDKEVLVSVDKKRVMMVEDYPLISFGDPKPTSRYQLK